jgi:hypothetical protein
LEAQYGEEAEYEELSRVMSPVRPLPPLHGSHFSTVPQKHRKEPQKSSGFPVKDSSRTIPFNPSSKHPFCLRYQFI